MSVFVVIVSQYQDTLSYENYLPIGFSEVNDY